MMKEYKKSFTGFIVILLLFIITVLFVPLLINGSTKLLTLLVINISVFWITVLSFVIYKTEYIYWYNGVEYEDAKKAGSDKRKKYAFDIFKRFGILNLIVVVYSCISYIINITIAADILYPTLGLVGVAISTINVKLTD